MGFIRFLLVSLLALFGLMLTLAILGGVVAAVMDLAVLLLPILVIYWLLTRDVQRRQAVPVRGPRRRQRGAWPWSQFQPAPPRVEPEEWAREAQQLAHDIRRVVRRSSRATRQVLAEVPGRAQKLAERVQDLTRGYAALEDSLRDNASRDWARQAAEMEQKAAASTDPFARDQYLSASKSLREHAEMCLELDRSRERIQAESARIIAALTNLRTRIVAATSGGATGVITVDNAAEELADLENQVGTFQESVRHVLRQAQRSPR